METFTIIALNAQGKSIIERFADTQEIAERHQATLMEYPEVDMVSIVENGQAAA